MEPAMAAALWKAYYVKGSKPLMTVVGAFPFLVHLSYEKLIEGVRTKAKCAGQQPERPHCMHCMISLDQWASK
jgi:hypothetical protein